MKKHQTILIDSAVILCLLLAVLMLLPAFVHIGPIRNIGYIHLIAISRFCQRFLAFLLLLLLWNLHKRKFFAWCAVVSILVGSSFLSLIHRQPGSLILLAIQIYCIVVLLIFHKKFRRSALRPSSPGAILAVVLVLAFFILNAVATSLFLRFHSHQSFTLTDSFEDIADYLFITGGHNLYSRFIFVFFWICVAVGVLFILRPVLYATVQQPSDEKRAREIVLKYGQNSASYLALEKDKSLYFGEHTEGVIAYGVVDNCLIVQADPICADEDFIPFLSEFNMFCRENDYHLLFMSTSDKYLEEYKKMGFVHVKCGEEARIDLSTYQLAGGKMARLRPEINHAVKKGVTVAEYKPLEQKDVEIERGIAAVTDDWLGGKKSSQLCFSVGDVNLDHPMDRRYFYAKDESGRIVAFNVFLPFEGKKGWMADVTRRSHDAPRGSTEKITFDAFMQFKEEGCLWGSMGVSPLANIEGEENEKTTIGRILKLVYEKGNRFYGFKSLHLAKEKYSPSQWIPSYFVYSKKAINIDMGIAIVKLQNPGGFADFFTSFFTKTVLKKDKKKTKTDNKNPAKEQNTDKVKADVQNKTEKSEQV